jgi:hypothetical protein
MTLINTNPGTNKKRSRIKTSGLVAIAEIRLATINYLRRARSIVAGIEGATPNLLSLFIYGISIAGEKEPRLFQSGYLLQMFTNILRPWRYALDFREEFFSEAR